MAHNCCSPVLQPTLREEAHAAGLEIKPLPTKPLGAEVVGLDIIHKPITPELVSVVRKALLTHKVSVTLCLVSGPLCPGDYGRGEARWLSHKPQPRSWVLPKPFLHVSDRAVAFPGL